MTPQQIDAMKLALEALKTSMYPQQKQLQAIASLEETLAEHAMRETQRLGQEIEQAPVAKYSDIVSDGGLDPRNTTPPQRTEQCNYPDCKCPTENPCLKGLVQPEQEPKIGCVNHDCDQCKAQPEQVIQSYSGKHNLEQEPVAWMDKYGEIYKDVPEVLSTDKPLYTSPPQRQPLTKEEMFEAIRPLYSSEMSARIAVDYSEDEYRAIEAAHGIKENT